jgi:hypothetical protein
MIFGSLTAFAQGSNTGTQVELTPLLLKNWTIALPSATGFGSAAGKSLTQNF